MLPRPAPIITAPINGRPKGLFIRQSGSILTLRFAWRSVEYAILAPIPIVLAVLGGNICSHGQLHILAGGALIALAVPIAWLALAGLLNRTTIEAGDGLLRVRHGPIPWPGPAPIPVADILQLYCCRREVGRTFGPFARVMIATEDGQRRALTWFMPPPRANWSIHIEKAIEEHLEIVNRPILCPVCGYDLRVTLRRCPECGHVLRSTKRQRRAWSAHIAQLLRRDRRR